MSDFLAYIAQLFLMFLNDRVSTVNFPDHSHSATQKRTHGLNLFSYYKTKSSIKHFQLALTAYCVYYWLILDCVMFSVMHVLMILCSNYIGMALFIKLYPVLLGNGRNLINLEKILHSWTEEQAKAEKQGVLKVYFLSVFIYFS